MNVSTIFVGLDYHQASVQVCVEDSTGRVLLNRRCRNDYAVIAAAVDPPHGLASGLGSSGLCAASQGQPGQDGFQRCAALGGPGACGVCPAAQSEMVS